MTEPIVWRSGGLSTCGYCYSGFGRENPPHLAIRHERGYDYDESEPWHEDCIDHANTALNDGSPDV